MPGLVASGRAFRKLKRDLHPFLATPLTARAADAILERRLADREQAFGRLVALLLERRPGSPLARLLRHAGAEAGDLRASVLERGLEETLLQLHRAGVRLTLDEMRGRVPIVRSGLEIQGRAEDFDNPYLSGELELESGGTTGGHTRSTFDLATTTDDAVYWALFLRSFELHGRPLASWYEAPPGVAGLKGILLAAKVGEPAERWFSQTPLRWSPADAPYAAMMTYLARSSRGAIPPIEHVPLDRVDLVLAWLAERRAAGRPAVLMCTPSTAVRVCLGAISTGVDIEGTFFRCGGEPYTPARDATIQAAGCAGTANYYASELGGHVGMACSNPREPGEVHVCSDRLALVEAPTEIGDGERLSVLAGTTLSATSPKIVINLETDDFASIDNHACGCVFEAIGLTTHLRRIRSHTKLTVEGIHFLGDELVRLVEVVLPGRFGGGPTSYQLVQHENAEGETGVLVAVAPAVGPVDESAVVDAVLEALAAGGAPQRHMTEMWRRAGTVAVVRREPVATARSKVLPVVRSTS